MKDRLFDIILWTSRRLRYAVLALLAVAAVKTAMTVLAPGPQSEPPAAPIRAAQPVALS